MLALLALGCFAVFEWYTSYFYLARLERATGLLERLASLDNAGHVGESAELKALRSTIVIQLRGVLVPQTSPESGQIESPVWKYVAGIAPWLLFAIVYLPSVRRDKSNWNGILGVIFFGVCFGFVALLIPNAWATPGVLIAFSLGHFFLFVLAVLAWQARKSAHPSPAG